MNENMNTPNNSEHQFSEVNPMADNRNAGGNSVPPSVTPSVTSVTLTGDEARRLAASLIREVAGGRTDGLNAFVKTSSIAETARVGIRAIQIAGVMLDAEREGSDDSPAERALALFASMEDVEPAPRPTPRPKAPAAPPVAPIQSAKPNPDLRDTAVVSVMCPYCEWTEDHIVPDDDGVNHRESHCHAGPYIIAGSKVAEDAK